MCGLAGYVRFAPVSPEEGRHCLSRMAGSLAHRGPDDEGVWVDADAGVGLGHRRLAVVDLTPSGHQPMHSASGRFVIAFNGEIYNHRDLRQDLIAQGCRFRGTSDTEVLLEAFAVWGVEATLPRLNGFFAIALWDRQERRLSLIRDRIGKKPLYWLARPDLFLFGSEPRALLAHPGWTARLDAQAAAQFLDLACVPAPMTIFAGMRKLMPGGMVVLSATGGIEEVRWWTASQILSAGVGGMSPPGDDSELHAVLRDAVRIRLEADVPVGALLSGGIDSALVVALAQEQSSRPVRTFTVGFDDRDLDERDAARTVARHLGTDHAELHVGAAEALAVIPRLATVWDEPFADSSQIATLLVAEFARRHVTVVLSGDGGDEGFAGYNRHRLAYMARRIERVPAPVRYAASRMLRKIPPATWDLLGRLMPASGRISQLGDKLHKAADVLHGTLDQCYPRLISQWPGGAPVVAGVSTPSPWTHPHFDLPDDPVDAMRLLDLAGYLPDDVLVKVDRATMAVGLEARAPLLDYRVLAAGGRYPAAAHFRDNRGKALLRGVLSRYLPPPVFERPKAGFAVPLAQWLRGPLRDWAEDLLSPSALGDGLLDAERIRAAWGDLLSGRGAAQHRLWTVLMLQAWRRQWRL